MFGKKGSKYKLRVEQKTAFDNPATVAAGYYDWTNKSFRAQSSTGANDEDGTILSGGSIHFVLIPPVTSDTRYDIYIDTVVDGVTAKTKPSKYKSRIPQGDGVLSIFQYGTRTLTLSPSTSNASNFGTLPADVTITRRKRFNGDSYAPARLRPVFQKAGTGGASSTKLVLDQVNSDVKANMLVTGAGIAHNTTVKSVQDNKVILSAAATVANNTLIRFDLNNGRLVPFSFTILPNSNTLSATANVDLNSKIGGLQNRILVKTNGTTSSSTTITLDDTRGILPGMIVGSISKYYAKGEGGYDLTVVSVTSKTAIVVSKALTLATDDIEFEIFGGKSVFDRFSQPIANSNVNIIGMTADDSTANVVISGYVDPVSIDATTTHPIYLDDIITVS